MEIHQLRYFVAVAEEGNFSRAAQRVRVAQPSLSQQIQKLEWEIGQPLFDRLPRSVVLTEPGRRFLTFARKILTDIADAQRCVDECKGEAVGRLVVGAIPTIAPYVLPRLLAQFQRNHPKVTVEVIEDVTEKLVRDLDNGELDLALVSTCQGGSHLHRHPLGKEPLLVALPAAHRLAKRGRVTWHDLKSEKFLALHEMHCLSHEVDRVCASHGVHPQVALRGAQLSTIVGMVAIGMGVSLVPQMMVDYIAKSGCAFLPMAGATLQRELNLIRNPLRHENKAVIAFSALATALMAADALPRA